MSAKLFKVEPNAWKSVLKTVEVNKELKWIVSEKEILTKKSLSEKSCLWSFLLIVVKLTITKGK